MARAIRAVFTVGDATGLAEFQNGETFQHTGPVDITGTVTADSFVGPLTGNADTASYADTAGSAATATYATTAGAAPASDVYTWAKASVKPGYTYSEVGAAAAAHTHAPADVTGFGAAGGVLVSDGAAWVRAASATITSAGAASFTSLGVTGRISANEYIFFTDPNSPHYVGTTGTGTATGQLNLQAGAGSAAYGGGIVLYSHAHATRPGGVYFGISAGSGGSIRWGDTGGDTSNTWMTLTAGNLFIGDTANANMTKGLTINQGAADDEILAFKSSDVAHGITSQAETDTYVLFKKYAAATGGVQITGLSAASVGLNFDGMAVNDNTTKGTTALGYVQVRAWKKDGTNVADPGADANLLCVRQGNTTRFIFDAEGSAHADVEWTTFDKHNDVAVIEDMETLLAPGFVQRQFGEVIKHDRSFFEATGLLHDVRDTGNGKMRGMLNTTRAQMLAFGAIRQIGSKQQRLETALRDILALNDNLIGRDSAIELLGAT